MTSGLAYQNEQLERLIASYRQGTEAIEATRERRPDVLLLDIEMPEVDGFDVARHLPDPAPLLIFQTAWDDYALQAFDHAAIDYLVKPVSRDRLERALERLRTELPRGRSPGLYDGADPVDRGHPHPGARPQPQAPPRRPDRR